MKPVTIGGKAVGEGHPCYVVAEIGINHNGDIDDLPPPYRGRGRGARL